MSQKVVCYYCGTIYDEERGKCPLCGSTTRSPDEAPAPVRRPRQTEVERTERKSTQGGRFAAKKKPAKKRQEAPKGVLVAAVVFLALAVLVVLYFIGDMIGWWPGLEDRVDRDNPSVSVADTKCTELTLKPETLEFTGAGQTKELTVRVNLSCEEKVYCHSEDMNVATISEQASTAMGEQTKSVTFTVTAVAQGETTIVVECGDQSASCTVVCASSDPVDPSGQEGSAPVLNYPVELTLTEKGASETLRVMNLPEGAEVIWRSANESVATVDADGKVTAVGSGSTTVTAEVNGRTAETTVRCTFGTSTEPSSNQPSTGGAHLQSGREDVSVSVGEKFDLFLYDSQGNHIDDITYTVDDPDICEVKDSYVIALSRGTTKITVTYQGQEFVCIVRVG